MNNEDIVEMAQDAGMTPISHVSTADVICNRASLERFAALVAAAEREACADQVYNSIHAWKMHDAHNPYEWDELADDLVAVLRKRGQSANDQNVKSAWRKRQVLEPCRAHGEAE